MAISKLVLEVEAPSWDCDIEVQGRFSTPGSDSLADDGSETMGRGPKGRLDMFRTPRSGCCNDTGKVGSVVTGFLLGTREAQPALNDTEVI